MLKSTLADIECVISVYGIGLGSPTHKQVNYYNRKMILIGHQRVQYSMHAGMHADTCTYTKVTASTESIQLL